ncbi:MAG: LytR C-terminal domain-containing protein [Deltaproteobacteria bacterium]|jgi:hypothetical protein|nr:LytR C-terminal domain-containing protein [Deltaproteobacteria bacterium]
MRLGHLIILLSIVALALLSYSSAAVAEDEDLIFLFSDEGDLPPATPANQSPSSQDTTPPLPPAPPTSPQVPAPQVQSPTPPSTPASQGQTTRQTPGGTNVPPQSLPPLNETDRARMERDAPNPTTEAGSQDPDGTTSQEYAQDELLTPSTSRVTGSALEPPPPPWQLSSRDPSGNRQAASQGTLPDFDATNTQWREMEVGDYERPEGSTQRLPNGQTPAITPPARSSVPVIPAQATTGPVTSTQSPPLAEPAAAPPEPPLSPQESEERAQLRELFEDMLPEPPPAAPQEPPAPQTPGTSTVTGSLAPPGAMGDEASALAPPLVQSGASSSEQVPLLPPPLPPREVGPDRSETPLAPAGPPIQAPPPPEDTFSGPAIGRAGSVMVEGGPTGQGTPQGSATILPPAAPPPPASQQSSSATAGQNSTPNKPAASSSSQGSGTAAPKRSPASVKPNLTVIIVNETGSPGTAENYRAVLSAIGYNVISVIDRANTTGEHKTLITYLPSKESQARALANRLPGAKELRASNDILSAEAVVIIR